MSVQLGYDFFFICKCLMMEVMNFCMLLTNITFFLVNITKTSSTHAPKKSYDSLKNHVQIIYQDRAKIAKFSMYYWNSTWHTQSYELNLLVKRSSTFMVTSKTISLNICNFDDLKKSLWYWFSFGYHIWPYYLNYWWSINPLNLTVSVFGHAMKS